MTIVVADSSPLNYLVLIDTVDLLPRLYGRILVPTEVIAELTDPVGPERVSRWAAALPDWVEVRRIPAADDPALSHLDPGERAAILLAESERDALLLIDDAAGRKEASRRGIPNIGTLGVLRAAALRNLEDLPTILARLTDTNFRVSASLVRQLLDEDSERKGGQRE
jgi:predicted nucleic acid-binding protein